MTARSRAGMWSKGALVLGFLAVGGAIGADLPRPGAELEPPFLVAGAVGEPIELRLASVTVTDVELGRYASDPSTGYAATGLWVKATVQYTPRGENAAVLGKRVVSADGTTSWIADRGDVDCPQSPPGVTVQCLALVDVPADRLPGASLHLRATWPSEDFDDTAVISLDVTGGQIEDAQSSEAFLDLPAAVVVESTVGARP